MNTINKSLIPQIVMGDKVYCTDEAARLGLELSQTITETDGTTLLTLTLRNHSGKSMHLDKFNWHREGNTGDFLNTPGLFLYLEGWQMATPCGIRKFTDRDYRFDAWYMPYAVAEPEDYSELPNHFRAEHIMMFHAPANQETLLMGFVTTGNQFGHFKTVLSETGVDSLDIRSSCDGMLVEPGDTVCSETLALMQGTDGFELQCRYADLLGQNMKARTHQMPPIGWCSWYYYFSEVTQADIALNVAYLAEHREQYPLRYIQLDDGYQAVLGDWLCCNDKFPDGLEGVAGMIRTQGFLPALWVAPFLAEENSALLRNHPDWMIHDEDGKVILQYPWRTGKAAILDGTNPEVLTHLKRLFARIREMGFDYVKLDFLIAACTVRNGVLHDSKATRAQALRRGLEAIREGFGKDGFILGCTVPFGASVGVVDGERISGDIAPYWTPDHPWSDEAPTMPNSSRNVIRHLYMNRRLWNNDPDTLIVRDDHTKLTENEVILWYELLRLTGGMLLLGDNLTTLSAKRSGLVKKLLREPDAYTARPVDFWAEDIPSILQATHRANGNVETALFNFSDARAVLDGKNLSPHSCRLTSAAVIKCEESRSQK